MTTDPQVDRTGYVPPAGPAPTANVNAPTPAPLGALAAPAVYPARDAVRWGPIWAGLVVAISSFLLLSLLVLVIGVQTIESGDVDEAQTAQTGAIITAGLALLAFLLGGIVAGRTSGVPGRAAGFLNGFLVWAVGIVLIITLTVFGGLGELFGAVGDLFAQLRVLGGGFEDEADRAAVVEGIQNSALIAFLSMALPALAASIGGWIGARGGGGYVEI